MKSFVSKLQNFWYYHKIPILIAVAVVIASIYLHAQSAGVPEADYHIGLVSITPRSDEALQALEDAIADAGFDRNGDCQVLIRLHNYPVDLADDSENAGVKNHQIVAALDADLIGHTSGLFLLEDPETFQAVTDERLANTFLPFRDGLYLCIPNDAEEAYQQLFEQIQES